MSDVQVKPVDVQNTSRHQSTIKVHNGWSPLRNAWALCLVLGVSLPLHAQPKNMLKEKFYGTWSFDCSDPKQFRHTFMFTPNGDELEIANISRNTKSLTPFQFQTITATKFGFEFDNISQTGNGQKVIIKVKNVSQFIDGNFEKFEILNSQLTNAKGEVQTFIKRGNQTFVKPFNQTEEKVYGGSQIMERCLN